MLCKHVIIIFLLFLLSISFVGAAPIHESKITLENFVNVNEYLYMVDVKPDGIYTVDYIHFGKQVENLTPVLLFVGNSSRYDAGKTDSLGRIMFLLAENQYNDATVIFFLDDNRTILGYMSMLRQSGKDLEELYNFTKPRGYTIVARTSRWFLPNQTPPVSWVPLKINSYPDLSSYYPRDNTPPEIEEIVALLRYFWKEPKKTGPSNIRYDKLDADTQLKLLENESWIIQCGEIRDIVASYAIRSPRISGVKIINAAQYYPPFPDLIGNVHGVMEIYSPTYNKWILVDPMFGKLFKYNGEYINWDDIINLTIDERKNIKPIKVTENSLSLNKTFSSYHLNQNYYTYFNTVGTKIIKEPQWYNKIQYTITTTNIYMFKQ